MNVHQEPLGHITEEDARREGYSSIANYRAAWERVYKAPWNDALMVWVVDFCLYDGPPPEKPQQTSLIPLITETQEEE